MLEYIEGELAAIRKEMDERSWVKKLPTGHALNYTPQPSVGFGMCEIE